MAEFLDGLIRGDPDKRIDSHPNCIFLEDDDFIAVVEGVLTTPRLAVGRSYALNGFIYQREGGGAWRLV